LGHATAGKAAEAVQIVDDTRNTVLRSLRSLLANCREQMETARRGVLLVFAGQAGRVGGLADRVCEVVKLSDDQIQPVECENLRKGVFIGIARWGDAGRLIQLLDVPAILRTAV
jgi:chemotaxis signal transduction protein